MSHTDTERRGAESVRDPQECGRCAISATGTDHGWPWGHLCEPCAAEIASILRDDDDDGITHDVTTVYAMHYPLHHRVDADRPQDRAWSLGQPVVQAWTGRIYCGEVIPGPHGRPVFSRPGHPESIALPHRPGGWTIEVTPVPDYSHRSYGIADGEREADEPDGDASDAAAAYHFRSAAR